MRMLFMMLTGCPARLALAEGPEIGGAALANTLADTLAELANKLRPGFGPADDVQPRATPAATPFPQWLC